jgi:hypothetical protein
MKIVTKFERMQKISIQLVFLVLLLNTFENLRFTFQELPKYNPNFFQPDHLAYMEEWKQMLRGREFRFEVYSEENRGETLEMPSFVNSGDRVYLMQGPSIGSCDAMRGN